MNVSDETLGAFLVESGTLSRRALDDVSAAAGARGEGLVGQLVAAGYVSRDEVRRAEAHVLGVPFIELDFDNLQDDALYLIPEPLSRTRSMIAYRHEEGVVEVALLDINDLSHLDFLRTERGLKVLPRLTTAESIKRALIRYQKKLKDEFKVLAKGSAHAVEALLRHALLSRASHVHLDFKTAGLYVRYRVHGLLHEAMTLPREAAALFAHLKDMAGFSKTLHVPQHGAFKVDLQHGETLRVRAHATPVHTGERLTLHLHPSSSSRRGFSPESLGFHGESLNELYKLAAFRDGLIAVTGPAQSGKTTLLYTLLDMLHSPERHLVTVEEDIELALPYATQVRVRPDVGLTTTSTLRAALKQDPDVVLVGNVSNSDVAELAQSAAARGVLVLAGTESEEMFANAPLRGSIKTRLVGRICLHCSESYKLSRQEAAEFDGLANFGTVLAALKEEEVVEGSVQWRDLEFSRAGAGCAECTDGYLPAQAGSGLLGLQEVQTHGEASLNLVEDGLFKAAQGTTSIEEVLQVALEGRADISAE